MPGFQSFFSFLCYFIMAKLASSSIRVKLIHIYIYPELSLTMVLWINQTFEYISYINSALTLTLHQNIWSRVVAWIFNWISPINISIIIFFHHEKTTEVVKLY